MNLSQESWSIRSALGAFLQELAFVDQRWIRLDSCKDKTVKQPGGDKEVDSPIEAF